MQNNFHLEIRRLTFLLIICIIFGLMTNQMMLILMIGAVLYILWTLFQIHQLEKWLKKSKLSNVPDASGIWGKVFDQLSRNKKREITKEKRLRKVINRVENMTGALNDAIILLNKDHDITWLNKASKELLGLQQRDINHSVTNLIRNPLFVRYLDSGDHSVPLILPSTRENEQRLEFRLNHFGDDEGLLIVRDVTRLYKLEQMRKDFVANVSHELRTPLTVIIGYIETLTDSQILSKNWDKPLEQMQQQSSRMITLINDLTTLSKLETDNTDSTPSCIALEPLLRIICDAARSLSGEQNHQITLNCHKQFALLGNERELHSAFSNLIFNAVKYTPAGKQITVDVGKNFTGGLDIHVVDKGIGIEQRHILRITERFYRVDSSRSIETGGTGLGLAIVKHIMVRHDGRLHIRSQLNQGSTFTTIFPKGRFAELNNVTPKHTQQTLPSSGK